MVFIVYIVYGVTANLSIGELFIAGVVPGLLLGLAYMALIWFCGRKENWPMTERASIKQVVRAFLAAAPSFTVPVIILGGILGGITTPTESAASASCVALFLGTVVYRKLKWSDMPKILERTGVVSASIMIIVAMANILGWTMALSQIPQAIAGMMLSLTGNKYLILLLVNIFLMFVGMVMETIAAIIILVPVFLPIIAAVGIDPLHFGLVVSFNLIIGLLTPPVGVTLFTTSIVTGTPLDRLIKPVWVWVGVAVVILMILTYIPPVATFLPKTVFH